MKKLSGVFICLLLFTFISSARIIEVADAGITDKLRAVIAAKNVAAPAGCDGTADVDYYTANTSELGVGVEDATSYSGEDNFQDSSGRTICNFEAKVTANGTIDTKSYYAKVWTLSGDNLDAAICTSAAVTGDSGWSFDTVAWDFENCTGSACSASGCAISASTDYALTLNCGTDPSTLCTPDASHYLSVIWADSDEGTGQMARWNSDKSMSNSYSGYDVQIKVYW